MHWRALCEPRACPPSASCPVFLFCSSAISRSGTARYETHQLVQKYTTLLHLSHTHPCAVPLLSVRPRSGRHSPRARATTTYGGHAANDARADTNSPASRRPAPSRSPSCAQARPIRRSLMASRQAQFWLVDTDLSLSLGAKLPPAPAYATY